MEREIKPESLKRRIRRARMSSVETIKVRKKDRERKKLAKLKVKAENNLDTEYVPDNPLQSDDSIYDNDYICDFASASVASNYLARASTCTAVANLIAFVDCQNSATKEKPVISFVRNVKSNFTAVSPSENALTCGTNQAQGTATLTRLQCKQGWTFDNRYVNTKVRKLFEGNLYTGVVTRFMRAKRKGYMKGPALFHIVYNDDDEEDVCLNELYECIDLHINYCNAINNVNRFGTYK